ncbi:uncharacterized protein LOC121879143 [Homarus americanus]|uniref:uncharacterized protein LOC121879143 n=1 Tax=Homarus americanus TaxID=6706 RepID=UPI001C440E54|nr:uncharacterized protein LOC121879143 [Homarus americanus]
MKPPSVLFITLVLIGCYSLTRGEEEPLHLSLPTKTPSLQHLNTPKTQSDDDLSRESNSSSKGEIPTNNDLPPVVNETNRLNSTRSFNTTNGDATFVFNATSTQSPDCPMLYTRVGRRCIALITNGKVTWPEARLFCKSIFGDLLTFSNATDYIDLLQYLQTSKASVDLWLGGCETMGRWRWVTDTPMPLGSPYWAAFTHDSFYRDLYTIPRHYIQPPYAYTTDLRDPYWWAAITTKHYLYLSVHYSNQRKSPLCELTTDQVYVAREA